MARRRIETAKLRTVCTYIAATLQLAEGTENVMLAEAARLSLGPGTELAAGADDREPPLALPPMAGSAAGMPGVGPAYAHIPADALADAPPSIRVGQPSPVAAGSRPVPFERLPRMLSGGPQ